MIFKPKWHNKVICSLGNKYWVKCLGIYCALYLCMGSALCAVDPPQLQCVSVNTDGSVTLTWAPPLDPGGEFSHYNVYVSDNKNGPYVMHQINSLLTSFFDDMVNNAEATQLYYYIETAYHNATGISISVASDTGATMMPAFGAVSDSNAFLTWNPVIFPSAAYATQSYTIFRQMGAAGYTNIGNTIYGNELYNDMFKVCKEDIYYRIEIDHPSGCVSISSVLHGLFEDKTAPMVPILDSVTVDQDQKVSLGWTPSSSLDCDGYLVFYWVPSPPAYIIRDSVKGRLNTTYLETSTVVDPTAIWQQYTVAAYDKCKEPLANTSAGADPQRTMFLTLNQEKCVDEVQLNWTPYQNWPELTTYDVMISTNGMPYEHEYTVLSTDTSFVHVQEDNYTAYCYKIRASNADESKYSTSNVRCATSTQLEIPSKQYFKEITVANNRDVQVKSLTDSSLPVGDYVLLRSLSADDHFFEVDRIPFQGNEIFEMHDLEAQVNQTSYYYRIDIEDSCKRSIFVSESVNSIFLMGQWDVQTLSVSLQWNPYLGWDDIGSGIDSYAINQIIDGNKKELATVSKDQTNYTYILYDDIALGANLCFEIEAREADGNIYGQKDSLVSNQICFTDNLKVFIPNSFTPLGLNPIFIPVISFGNVSTYHLVIYNNWGGVIFETYEADKGWDGYVNQHLAENGQYTFQFEIANFTGVKYSKTGSLFLIR